MVTQPRLRGRLHQLAAIASMAGFAWLLESAHTTRAVAAAWVYGLASIALYLTSSYYHVYARTDRTRRILQRLDHSLIYVLIAGTYTPVCLLALRGDYRWVLLAVVWVGALAGALLTAFALGRYQKLRAALYIGLGWIAILAIPDLMDQPHLLTLALTGGLLYTIGAVLFALHWPGPAARWFGYHEFWHAIGIAAGGVLFAMNLGLIAGG
jgi:hemolysin III